MPICSERVPSTVSNSKPQPVWAKTNYLRPIVEQLANACYYEATRVMIYLSKL